MLENYKQKVWEQYKELAYRSKKPEECMQKIEGLVVKDINTSYEDNGKTVVTEIYVQPSDDSTKILCLEFYGDPKNIEKGDILDAVIACYKKVRVTIPQEFNPVGMWSVNETFFVPQKLEEIGEKVEAVEIYNRRKKETVYSSNYQDNKYIPPKDLEEEIISPL